MPRYRSQTGLLTAGIGSVIASTTAPVAHIGQRWFNTATAVTYQYTIDAAGTTFWLDISSGGIGAAASRGVDFVGDTDPHLESAVTGDGLAVGSVYYNREADRYFVCTTATNSANVWAGRFAGSGGIETTYKSGSDFFRVHTFLGSGSFLMDGTTDVEYLIVAGGGGGGMQIAGGGGAGGYRTNLGGSAVSLGASATDYTITVGKGGLGSITDNGMASNGGVSSIAGSGLATITATGGGGGSSYNTAGAAGGSGGGAGIYSQTGGAGTYNAAHTLGLVTHQGRNGGNSSGSPGGGGGGGGASAVGANGVSDAGGAGGAGTTNTIRDGSTAVTYAGGGGGGGRQDGATNNGPGGAGGAGGGGAGVSAHVNAVDGTDGLGGGGGGTGYDAVAAPFGARGGSGIVILRYQINA